MLEPTNQSSQIFQHPAVQAGPAGLISSTSWLVLAVRNGFLFLAPVPRLGDELFHGHLRIPVGPGFFFFLPGLLGGWALTHRAPRLAEVCVVQKGIGACYVAEATG